MRSTIKDKRGEMDGRRKINRISNSLAHALCDKLYCSSIVPSNHISFETDSHEVQAGLELFVYLRVILKF